MPGTGIAGYIAGWQPSSVSPQAAGFARAVVTRAAPGGRERAKNLLWAAGRLADWATGLGLEPVPEVLLHSSVIERFTAHATGPAGRDAADAADEPAVPGPRGLFPRWRRRTRRCPASTPRRPYAPAEIDGYLALAGAQPTAARRMRAAGLVCLGAGAGLIRADLRPGPRHRHQRPLRRRDRDRPRPQAASRAGAGPLPRAAAGISRVRRRPAGHRRDRSRPAAT